MNLFLHRILYSFIALLTFYSAHAAHLSDELMFSTRLSGDQEVPMVTTDAVGVATMTLNSTMDTLCLTYTGTGLSGAITGIHIHEGAAGENGDVVIDLTPFLNGNRLATFITGDDLTPALLASMLSGANYLNVHTDLNPGGEIRGQIGLETDLAFRADLNADNQPMPVDSDGEGIAYFNLSSDMTTIQVQLTVSDLSGPITAAHLHTGAAGTNGPVAIDLGPTIQDNTLEGVIGIGAMTDFIDDLLAGDIYVNVHTEMFPSGEIRSQLARDRGIAFDAALNTAQEVSPPVDTDATGTAVLSINNTMDTLFYVVQAEGLSGPLTGAHLHLGEAGEDGFVVLNLTSSIDMNRVQGFSTDATFISGFLGSLLTGGVYINLHTDANSDGEIRGQIERVAREGYSFVLEGVQEVPSVATTATGSGMVSIDRNRSNAHYMMVVNDLSGPLTGAHFHNAPEGENGPVVFGLTDSFVGTTTSDAAFGYWTADDMMPFENATEVLFRNEEVYVNIHTDANAGGEVRGQVRRGSSCFETVVYENGSIPTDPMFEEELFWSVRLNGDNEVPAVTTDALGVAGLVLNATRDTIYFEGTFDGLSGPITGIHFHEGDAGENGDVIFNLTDDLALNQVAGTITDFDLGMFIDNGVYLNVHTDANAAGEIRGQVTLENDIVFGADLDGDNEVPAVDGDATGYATFALSQDGSYLDIKAVVTDLTGPITGAHLHAQAEGVNGPVVLDLTSTVVGSTIFTSVVPTAEVIDDMMAGNIYLNVHTAANPDGEVRGQLELDEDFAFDAMISAAQSVPENDVPGMGVALFTLNEDWTALDYTVFLDGLTGDIQSAHIHSGAIGENGDVVIDLTADIDGNTISGSTTVGLTAEVISAMLTGEAYINIHTVQFPNGEIRGQIFRTARDGYVVDVCGAQEVPALDAVEAYGTAIVSVDRGGRSSHVMFTTTALTGAITGAHLHEGAIGTNGDVIYNLTDNVQMNSGFAYLPLMDGDAQDIKDGGLYLNVHTEANAGGELRGQVDRVRQCPAPSIVDDVLELDRYGASLGIYPNPTKDVAYLDYDLGQFSELDIEVFDILGNRMTEFQLRGGEGRFVLDMSSYAKGLYLLTINSDRDRLTKRVVKH